MSRRTIRLAVAALAGSAALVYGVVSSAAGETPPNAAGGTPRAPAESRLASNVDSGGFNIESFNWAEAEGSNEPLLTVGRDQSTRLLDCGSDAWESSMLVLARQGVAYCIEPITPGDAESIYAAKALARELIDGLVLSDAQLNVLRLQALAGYADQESVESARYHEELDEAWDQLSPEEREELSG